MLSLGGIKVDCVEGKDVIEAFEFMTGVVGKFRKRCCSG
jgi:hypothetical protein